jgi:predicted methyltransferase
MKWVKFLTASAILAGSVSLVSEALEAKKDAVWRAVHDNPHRAGEDAGRDAARNPEAFLRFLGLTPEMTVAEVNPGGGWYSRILGPFLKEKGRYVGLEHHPDVYRQYEKYAATLAAYPQKLEAERDMYGPRAVATWIPASEGLPLEAGTLDAVLVVRALHNWYRQDFFDTGFTQLHAMMKDGAVLGVVQHRADEGFDGDTMAAAERGRWKQDVLIGAIEAHGFKLVDTSEMNANPRDTKDYEHGVWTLPPRYALGDQDRARYRSIGESDRMTLKFVKVAKAE